MAHQDQVTTVVEKLVHILKGHRLAAQSGGVNGAVHIPDEVQKQGSPQDPG
jgi:hypothetical protein